MDKSNELKQRTIAILQSDLDAKTKYFKVKNLETEYAETIINLEKPDHQISNALVFFRLYYYVNTSVDFKNYRLLAQYALHVLETILCSKKFLLNDISEFKMYRNFYFSNLKANTKNSCSNYINELVF